MSGTQWEFCGGDDVLGRWAEVKVRSGLVNLGDEMQYAADSKMLSQSHLLRK